MSTSGYEYGSNDYGGFGGGGYGGGGLDPMGGGQQGFGTFGDAAATGNKSAEKKGAKERQSLLPVTIKQLQDADNSEDIFKVDGAELFTVKIVATIYNVEEHATNHTFQVSDGTGSIECKKWIEKDGSSRSEKQSQCKDNTLVRICGCLREYEGKRHVLVYDMTPISDWNEMTHHFLEAIYVHLKHTRGSLNDGSMKMETSSFASPGMAGHMGAGAGVGRQGVSMGGGQDAESALIEIFKADTSEGVNCETALRMIRSNPAFSSMNLMQVREIVTNMSNQGRLYSTIDDDHFKSTE